MMQLSCVIDKNEELVPGIFRLWFKAPQISEASCPGQFIMVRCGEHTVLRRPLSVHRIQNDRMALLFQVRGKGTEWLSKQKSGDNLDIFGPMGKGFTVSRQSRNIMLVAGGIGIAPLYYLAETTIKKGCVVTLLIGAATSKQLYPVNQLSTGVKIVLATDDGSAGQKGMVTDLIPRHVSSSDQVFACGPLPMLKYMSENMKKLGLPDKKVQISLEMRMGCGVGVCYGCTMRTKSGLKQACKDGPVFDLDEIILDELIRI